jgi:hypothetical protein
VINFKKYLLFFLLSSLWLWQVGYYFLFIYEQQNIKYQVLKSISQNHPFLNNNFVWIAVSQNDIVWEEEGRELVINNNLYDVVTTSMHLGKSYYVCINDTQENDLIAQYCSYHKKTNQTKKSSFPEYHFTCISSLINLFKPSFFDYTKQTYPVYRAFFVHNHSAVLYPPPKC